MDGFVKSPDLRFFIIPVKTGIRYFPPVPDSGFRRTEDISDFSPVSAVI